jgi:PHD/YefM family antitoxin component YafN of YafNO toxin-antitoxin module
VLRRLAELDVLRRVEVLSTVSGGSITGALYALLLKKYLERARPVTPTDDGAAVVALTRQDYEQLVCELERYLVRGVQKNLRTRLLWPLRHASSCSPVILSAAAWRGYTSGTCCAMLSTSCATSRPRRGGGRPGFGRDRCA